MIMARALCATTLGALVAGWNVANTPPMGFNTWNLYGCSVDAAILNDTAKAMVDFGLFAAGYIYVNSDDCWMTATRNAQGQQVADPAKFPNGFQAVTGYIHSLGMKSGLYTAKGPLTCQKRAASCEHEVIDAAQWASWGIDYVKDDSCSLCSNFTDNELYGKMWAAIQAAGRPMVLTVEGNPTDAIITNGGYGNAKRVGHDISPHWQSMTSLVDIGANLWMYAHNSTNPLYGGWWNDLDMIEIGNAPDFVCGTNASSLARCQAHFTMWTIMKALLILGNNIPQASNATLSVLLNAEAIAVNQDALGVQARRVNVTLPPAAPAPAASRTGGPLAVLEPCNASAATQKWHWAPASRSLATVDAEGIEWCLVDAHGSGNPGSLLGVPCPTADASTRVVVEQSKKRGGGARLVASGGASVGWNVAAGATGPLPHTRHLQADPFALWSLAPGVLASGGGAGGSVRPAPGSGSVPDDDMVGHAAAARAEDWCLGLALDGTLEVWAGPLTAGRWAVSLFNRAFAAAPITVSWPMFNVSAAATFAVRDIWAQRDVGDFTGSYTATVPAEATAYLVLTPTA